MVDEAEGKQHSITEAAPNELKLGEDEEGEDRWPSGRRWRGGVQASFEGKKT